MTFLTSTSTRPTIDCDTIEIKRGPMNALATYAASLWHAYRNRRAIVPLMAMSHSELRDLGLTHSDVAGALAQPLRCDPSRHLADQLVERRRAERLTRLCHGS